MFFEDKFGILRLINIDYHDILSSRHSLFLTKWQLSLIHVIKSINEDESSEILTVIIPDAVDLGLIKLIGELQK